MAFFHVNRIFRKWFSHAPSPPKPQGASLKRLALERLEDRATPAIATLLNGTLTIDFTAAGDQVTAALVGSAIELTGSFSPIPAPFSGVDRIVLADSGNLTGQKMTFGGDASFLLANGLAASGVETVVFNQGVDASQGTAALSVSAPVSIAVRGDLSGGSGGVSLVANPSATGTATYGILVENGAAVSTTGGDTVLTGTAGNSGSGFRTGIILQGSATVGAGGAGAVTVTGSGGLNGGPSNLGVSIADSSSVTSAGGSITVRGTGGAGNGALNIGVRLSSTASIANGGSGAVLIEGTGGTGSGTGNHGVYLAGASKVTSQGGLVTVQAAGTTGTAGAAGLAMESATLIESTGGSISLESDSIDTAGATINASGGSVSIAPGSPGLPIGIGAADRLTGTLSLGLSSAELSAITADSLVVGSGTAGPVTVHASASAPLVLSLGLTSGESINAAGPSVVLAVESLVLQAGTGIGNLLEFLAASKDIIASSVSGSVSIGNSNTGVTTANLAGDQVNFHTSGSLDITGVSSSGDVSLLANGEVTQSGTITVSGTTTLETSSTSDITLNLANNFTTIAIAGALNASLTDTDALALRASMISGNLSVASGGNITQVGTLLVPGTATFNTGLFDVFLIGDNDFGSVGITAANNSEIRDINSLVLALSTLSGSLTMHTGGAVTQSGAASVSGAATFFAGTAQNITLDNPGNNFSSIGIASGAHVSITDANALILAASTISGALTVSTSGPITQSGALAVSGTATLASGSTHDITLGNLGNDFSSLGITSGANVSIADANALILEASTVSGGLGVTTNGAITQSGALAVSGTATFASGSTHDITLGNLGNDFSSLGITSGANVSIADANALILEASTVSGGLGVTTNGAITQSGALAVSGTATFASGSTHDITLTVATNDFSSLGITSGANVSIADANALILEASTVSGALGVTTSGAITQTGALAVTGASTFDSGAANDITLDKANSFSSLGFAHTRNASVLNAGGIVLSDSLVSGNLALVAGGDITDSGAISVAQFATLDSGAFDITLDNANEFNFLGFTTAKNVTVNDISALALNASNISGDLTITTGGNLTDNGNLLVAGDATLSVGAFDITLDNNHDFASLGVTSGNNVVINDISALALNASTIAGDLSVTTGGNLTDTGDLAVAGAATLNAGAFDITLDNANNYGSLGITAANNAVVNETGALALNASALAGTFSVTTMGSITQAGIVSAAGSATFSPGQGNDITLALANNLASVSLVGARNVVLNEADSIRLDACSIDLDLTLVAGGAVTQESASNRNLIIGGTASITTPANQDVTLDNANNRLNQVSIPLARNARVENYGDLVLGASTLHGSLDIRSQTGSITGDKAVVVFGPATFASSGSTADITLIGPNDFNSVGGMAFGNVAINDINDIILRSFTVGGSMTVTAAGSVTQSGALVVGGAFSLAAAGGISLSGENDFQSIGFQTSGNASVNDINGIILEGSTIGGTLTVSAGGSITQSGPLLVAGAATLGAGSFGITLGLANDFNSLGITGADNVLVNDINALVLNASAITGDLSITASGNLTDNGAIQVAGTASLAVGAFDITLDNANNFNALGITTAANILVNDTTGLVFSGVAATGSLTVTASGAITQTGIVSVLGNSSLGAGASGDITLDLSNDFSSVAFPSARNVRLQDVNSVILSGGSLTGQLYAFVDEGITQSAPLVVSGSATFNAIGDIVLDQANNFSSLGCMTSGNLVANDINGITLNFSLVRGNLGVTAGGPINAPMQLGVGGNASFIATGPGNLSVASLSCEGFIRADTFQGSATVVNAGPIQFTGTVNGVLSLKAAWGGITDLGPISATGGIVLEAPGQSRIDQDLSGPGGLTFRGTGSLLLTGSSTFTGPTMVSGGSVTLAGSLSGSPVKVVGGLLTGNGAFKSLAITGGTVNPDLAFQGGALSLGKAGNMVFQVGGLVPGVNQARVTASSAALAGRLVIAANPAFQTVMGARITLIDNTGASKVSGQFAGLPEGSLVMVNTMRYFISYRGGAGRNDVVLNRPTIVTASAANRLVSAFDKDGIRRASILPFGNYLGKVTIATGDVTGDGVPDIVTGSGQGNRPHVRVFNGVDLAGEFSQFIFEPSFRGEVSVATADFNGDGKADIIAGAGRGDPGLVRIFSGDNFAVLRSFHPFGQEFTGGVIVSAGDFTNDGVADMVFATGGIVPSAVRIHDGVTGNLVRALNPFLGFSGAVSLSVGDFNGDGRVDLFVGAGAGGKPDLVIFNGATGRRLASYTVFNPTYRGGISIAAMDYNGDGLSEVAATPLTLKTIPVAKVFGFPGLRVLREFAAVAEKGGASVATAD